MEIKNAPEFSNWGKFDCIPGVSLITGLTKLIHSLYMRVVHPNTPTTPLLLKHADANWPPNTRKDFSNISFWSEGTRAVLALIPFIGNGILLYHDYETNQHLQRFLRSGSLSKEEFVKFWKELPSSMKTSKDFIRGLCPKYPVIVSLLDPSLQSDRSFIQSLAPQIEDSRLSAEEFKAFWEELPPALKTSKDFIRSLCNQYPQVISLLDPSLQSDRAFIQALATKTLKILQYAPVKFLKDGEFFSQLQQKIWGSAFPDFWQNTILSYADPSLLNDPNFILRMADFPQIKIVEYLSNTLKDKEQFILALLKKLVNQLHISSSINSEQDKVRLLERRPADALKEIYAFVSPTLLNQINFKPAAEEIVKGANTTVFSGDISPFTRSTRSREVHGIVRNNQTKDY